MMPSGKSCFIIGNSTFNVLSVWRALSVICSVAKFSSTLTFGYLRMCSAKGSAYAVVTNLVTLS